MRNVMLDGGGTWTDAEAEALAAELAKSGAVLLLGAGAAGDRLLEPGRS